MADDARTQARRGWFLPARPGPSLRAFAAAAGIGALALALWLMLGMDLPGSSDAGDGRERRLTLEIDDDGSAELPSGRIIRPEARSAGRIDYLTVRAAISMPGGDERMRIDLDLPAGVEARDVSLRASAPAAVVRLRRTADDEPYVTVRRVRGGAVRTDLLLAMPADGFVADAPDDAPRLSQLTGPFDDRVVDTAASGRRLDALHRRAVPFALIALLLGIAVPAWAWLVLQRRWYRSVPRAGAGGDAVTGPPVPLGAVAAASITAGASGIEPADAFAGHVLGMVETKLVRLRHTNDPRTGEGSVLGIGIAASASEGEGGTAAGGGAGLRLAPEAGPDPLDRAALTLLEVVANAERDTVHLPDSTRLVIDRVSEAARADALEAARARWHVEVARAFARTGVVERPRWQVAAGAAVLSIVACIVGIVWAIVADYEGQRATALLLAAASIGPAVTCSLIARELRGWQRVRRAMVGDRLRWLAWRGVLDGAEASGTTIDRRNLPYAVATGNAAGVAPRIAGPTSVELAAATPALIDGLRVIAGGHVHR